MSHHFYIYSIHVHVCRGTIRLKNMYLICLKQAVINIVELSLHYCTLTVAIAGRSRPNENEEDEALNWLNMSFLSMALFPSIP